VRQVPGCKTDIQDCQWLQELHTYGLVFPFREFSQDSCGFAPKCS
jgi:hypothetical protein